MAYPKPRNRNEQGNAQFLQQMQDAGWYEPQPYAEETIDPNKRFLLVCEGKNTEPHYFNESPVPTNTVKVVGDHGGGKMYLVTEALKLQAKDDYAEHEVWCVFDYDVKPDNLKQKEDFNSAVQKAEANGWKVAFSNDSFELWFVLHYQYVDVAHTRHKYFELLEGLWPDLSGRYEEAGKSDAFCRSIYQKLLPLQETALKAAERLHGGMMQDARSPADMNPCTTVYLLVNELNRYIKP